MSIPALRQPKAVKKEISKPPLLKQAVVPEAKDFLIVTLKDGKKLVVPSDFYHGILTAGGLYKCVFCEKEMILNILCKDNHKNSQNHRKFIESYPHVEDFKENLIRKLSGSNYYCTICNVIVHSHFIHKHITTETHVKELEKAFIRAGSYTPTYQRKEEFPALKKK